MTIAKRSTKMYLINEDLARAHIELRMQEAEAQRRVGRLARANRLSRRAERAAQRARVAIARSL